MGIDPHMTQRLIRLFGSPVLVMCVTGLMPVAGNAAATPISIVVVAPRHFTDSLVDQIRGEAQAIWAPAGIAFQWRRDACEPDARGLTTEVIVEDRSGPTDGDSVLGWIAFTNEGPSAELANCGHAGVPSC